MHCEHAKRESENSLYWVNQRELLVSAKRSLGPLDAQGDCQGGCHTLRRDMSLEATIERGKTFLLKKLVRRRLVAWLLH